MVYRAIGILGSTHLFHCVGLYLAGCRKAEQYRQAGLRFDNSSRRATITVEATNLSVIRHFVCEPATTLAAVAPTIDGSGLAVDQLA